MNFDWNLIAIISKRFFQKILSLKNRACASPTWMCSSKKYPCSPHLRDWKFEEGGVPKESMKLNWNFQWGRESQEKSPPWGGGGTDIFYNYTTLIFFIEIISLKTKWPFINNNFNLHCQLWFDLTLCIHFRNFLLAPWCARLCTESVKATAFTLSMIPLQFWSWN